MLQNCFQRLGLPETRRAMYSWGPTHHLHSRGEFSKVPEESWRCLQVLPEAFTVPSLHARRWNITALPDGTSKTTQKHPEAQGKAPKSFLGISPSFPKFHTSYGYGLPPPLQHCAACYHTSLLHSSLSCLPDANLWPPTTWDARQREVRYLNPCLSTSFTAMKFICRGFEL